MSWQVVFTKQAQKDAKKLAAAGLRPKAESLMIGCCANASRKFTGGEDAWHTPSPVFETLIL